MHKWHTVGPIIKHCRSQWRVYVIAHNGGKRQYILHSSQSDLAAAQAAQNQIQTSVRATKNRANIRANSKYRE